MKKYGFTLVEVLVVIAVIAVISLITIPNYIKIRNDVIQKSYENKIKNIIIAAEDWGYDNLNEIPSDGVSCGYVIVNDLINKGYLAGDSKDKTQLIDPRDNESMNNIEICLIYDINDGLTAELR